MPAEHCAPIPSGTIPVLVRSLVRGETILWGNLIGTPRNTTIFAGKFPRQAFNPIVGYSPNLRCALVG